MTSKNLEYISYGLLLLWFASVFLYNVIKHTIDTTEERVRLKYARKPDEVHEYIRVTRFPIYLQERFIIDTQYLHPDHVERILENEIENRLVKIARSPEFRKATQIVIRGNDRFDFEFNQRHPPGTKEISIRTCIYDINY
jgi:hypothetical protein